MIGQHLRMLLNIIENGSYNHSQLDLRIILNSPYPYWVAWPIEQNVNILSATIVWHYCNTIPKYFEHCQNIVEVWHFCNIAFNRSEMPLKTVSMPSCIIPPSNPFKSFYGLFLWQEHYENIVRTFAEHCCLFATVNILPTLSLTFQRLVTIL